MKKKPAVQIFKIRLGVFYTYMMTKLGFMKRDSVEFVKQGVDQDKIAEVEDLLTEYSEIPTDDELIGAQMNATAEKDSARDKLRASISEIIDRAASKYGANSGYYRKFGIYTLSEIDGGELSSGARRVFRVGTSLISELASEGLTQAMLDAVKENNLIFDKALANQEDAISDREIAAEERIERANYIYGLMSNYCDKGKRIWVSTNQAKYNDYVIYDTPSGKPEEPVVAKA